MKSFLATVLLIAVIAGTSVTAIRQYKFAADDQSIKIPFLKMTIDPHLYPNDYLTQTKKHFCTFLWTFLALIMKWSGVDLYTLFFLAYFASLIATLLAFYAIAMTLFGRRDVAYLALFIILFVVGPNTGIQKTFHELLSEKEVARPFILFAIALFLNKRYVAAFVSQGIAFLIHPMTALHGAIPLIAALIFFRSEIGAKRVVSSLIVLALVASPVLVWKLFASSPQLNPFYADAEWVKIIFARSPHHIYPFSGGEFTAYATLFTVIAFIISSIYKPSIAHHRYVLVSVSTVITIFVVGYLFSAVIPVPIVLQLQPCRSFILIVYFVIIYAAHFIVQQMSKKNWVWDFIQVSVVIALLFLAGSQRKIAIGAFLVYAGVVFIYNRILRREIAANHLAAILSIIVVIAGLLSARYAPPFRLDDSGGYYWVDVQKWAKANTAIADAFIVPPGLEGFRIESERTIYGDYKDGTMAFFDPAFGLEWRRRMEMLKSSSRPRRKNFLSLREDEFRKIAGEMKFKKNTIYLVMYRDRDILAFPLQYKNNRFVIYRVE